MAQVLQDLGHDARDGYDRGKIRVAIGEWGGLNRVG